MYPTNVKRTTAVLPNSVDRNTAPDIDDEEKENQDFPIEGFNKSCWLPFSCLNGTERTLVILQLAFKIAQMFSRIQSTVLIWDIPLPQDSPVLQFIQKNPVNSFQLLLITPNKYNLLKDMKTVHVGENNNSY